MKALIRLQMQKFIGAFFAMICERGPFFHVLAPLICACFAKSTGKSFCFILFFLEQMHLVKFQINSQSTCTCIYVTGEKMEITLFFPTWDRTWSSGQSPNSTTSLWKPFFTTRQYKCVYIYTRWLSPPSNWNSSLNFLGVRESWEMRLKEFYAHLWFINRGSQM